MEIIATRIIVTQITIISKIAAAIEIKSLKPHLFLPSRRWGGVLSARATTIFQPTKL